MVKTEQEPEPEKKKRPGKEEAKEIDKWNRRFSPQGTILKAGLDTEHWMSFGLKENLPILAWSSRALMAKPPVKTIARFAGVNDLRVSGLLWPEGRERFAGTAYATRESKGKGQVILFANGPNIRAYFYGSRKLFLNAVLYGPGMGSRFEGPYGEND
jgi:hypothetical protein